MGKNCFKLISSVLLSFLLCGCGAGISTQEYESVKTELDACKAKIAELEEANKNLEEEASDYSSEKADLVKQLLEANKKVSNPSSVFSDNYIMSGAWATSSFGDGTVYSELGTSKDIAGDYFQIVVPSNYTIKDNDEIVSKVGNAFALAEYAKLSYSRISVKYCDKNGCEIMDIVMSKDSASSYGYSVESISINMNQAGNLVKE